MKKAKYTSHLDYILDKVEIIIELLTEKGILTTKDWERARDKVWKTQKREFKEV